MPAPIYVPQRQSPWENMLPRMLQSIVLMKLQDTMQSKNFERELAASREQAGTNLDLKMQQEGRYQYTDQWASRGVPGGVRNPYTGSVYGKKPSQQIGQVMVGGNPFATVTDPVSGKVTLQPLKQAETKPWKLTDQGLITVKDGRVSIDPRFKKDPETTISQDVNEKGLKTITAINKKTGKVLYQTKLGPVGKPTVGRTPQDIEAMTPTVRSQTQKEVKGLMTQLNDLTALKEDYKSDFLTYQGKFKKWALNQTSRFRGQLSPEDQKYVSGARKFVEGVEQIFNQYRKQITGAQAAMKEIKMLRDSILNKDLSPAEFEASYDRYAAQIKRQLRLKRELMRQGFKQDTPIDKKKFGKVFDDRVKSGSDVSPKEMNARGDEIASQLLQQGIPQDQIQTQVLSILKEEGYY